MVFNGVRQSTGGGYKRAKGKFDFIVWPINILDSEDFNHLKKVRESEYIGIKYTHKKDIPNSEYSQKVEIPIHPTQDVDFPLIKEIIENSLKIFEESKTSLTRPQVTQFITDTLWNLGRRHNFQVELEPMYKISDLFDEEWCAFGDVLWKENNQNLVMWEIDSTNKSSSVIKLLTSPAKYNVWLPWSRKLSRLKVNCLKYKTECLILRPDKDIINKIWSKIKSN